MSTPHRYNTRSKKQMDADPIPIPSGDVGADRSECHCHCQGCASDHMCHNCCVVLYAHPSYYNTRSTDTSKAFKTGTVLCNKALNTSCDERPNDRVEKMIEFMRWIRTHKRMLVIPSFKRTCYKKCHQYTRKATSTSVSKRVKSKLLKSLVYECSLILDIIENEF